MKVKIDDLLWFGRNLDNEGIRYFDYSATGFCFLILKIGMKQLMV